MKMQPTVLSPYHRRSVLMRPAQQNQKPDQILDSLAHDAFKWFEDARLESTGMVADRWPNHNPPTADQRSKMDCMASVASCGYFLSVLPEAVKKGWITRKQAIEQAMTLLIFAKQNLEGHDGLFYHFVHWKTGRRWDKSEVSVLDSAIFFNGCMVAAEGFRGQVVTLADSLVDAADWPKFLSKDPQTGKALLALGWSPEKGLFALADVRSSEFAMPYFLAVGSLKHSIDPHCWYNTRVSYRGVPAERCSTAHPLFTSYYGLGWHDIGGMVDREGVDMVENARQAALANRDFCRGLGQVRDLPAPMPADGGESAPATGQRLRRPRPRRRSRQHRLADRRPGRDSVYSG